MEISKIKIQNNVYDIKDLLTREYADRIADSTELYMYSGPTIPFSPSSGSSYQWTIENADDFLLENCKVGQIVGRIFVTGLNSLKYEGDIVVTNNSGNVIQLEIEHGINLYFSNIKIERNGTTNVFSITYTTPTGFADLTITKLLLYHAPKEKVVFPDDISNFIDSALYDSTTYTINLYHGDTVISTINASDFIVDDMIDSVSVSGSNLVITFNTASGTTLSVSIPISNIIGGIIYDSGIDINYIPNGAITGAIKDAFITLRSLAQSLGAKLILLKDGDTYIIATIKTYGSTFNMWFNNKDKYCEILANADDSEWIASWTTMYVKPNTGIPKTDLSSAVQESLNKADSAVQDVSDKADKDVDAVVGNLAEFDSNGNPVDSGENIDEYAKKDGYYGLMVVGSAVNIAGQTQRTNDAMYRKSGDSEEVITGTATIANINGKTVAWNQYVGTSTTSVTTIIGRVYYTNIGGVESLITGDGSDISVTGGTDMVVNLTLIYGVGNEPTTPEQFKADYQKWFGKPLTDEAYDAGSLRSVQLEGLKTTGFNQWDEEWEDGFLDINGTIAHNTHRVVSKNFIPVLPNNTYCLNDGANNNMFYCFYDGEFNIIGSRSSGRMTTAPSNAQYMKFMTGSGYVAPYKNDICINISDPSKNGTYEPYEEHVAPLPVTTLKGKLNGQGESVTIFPDGMKSAGSIADEIYTVGDKTYAVQRVGSVDLSDLSYGVSGNNPFFYSSLTNAKYGTSCLICAKYASGSIGSTTTNDKVISRQLTNGTQLRIRDSSYSIVSDFTTAMNGVMLYYELATPLVYEVEGFTLPKTYLVDGGGTEEQVQKTGVQGLAAILTCKYSVNVLDKMSNDTSVIGESITKLYNEHKTLKDIVLSASYNTIDATNYTCMKLPLVIIGTDAPYVTPKFIGLRYHDNTNLKVYEAFSVTNSISDWVLLN